MNHNLPERVQILPDAFLQDLGGETAVVLHTKTERYYSLSPEATQLFKLLQIHGEVAFVIDEFRKDFDVDKETLEKDLAEMIQILQSAGLVTVSL